MKSLMRNRHLLAFCKFASLSLALVLGAGNQPAFSQANNDHNDINDSTTFMSKIFNPPNEGAPAQTVGGATRGVCSEGDLANVTFERNRTGITAQFPEGMANKVFYNLRNADNITLHQGFIPVENNTASISTDLLSETADASQIYTWSMAIVCGQALRPDSPVFRGPF